MENKETAKVVNWTTAKEIASVCKTCKECETHYKGLLETGIDKADAKQIVKDAKQIVNSRKADAKQEKNFVKGWFADFEKVGKSLLIGICKEESIKFSAINSKYNTIEEFIKEYVTKADASGQPIRKEKNDWYYKNINSNNIKGLLNECICNYIALQNLQKVNFIRIESIQVLTK